MALNELVAKLKWEKLGIISERNAYGSGLLKSFVEKLRTEDVWITAAEDFRSGKAERITKNILSVSHLMICHFNSRFDLALVVTLMPYIKKSSLKKSVVWFDSHI